jgi:hypothetical protein
MANNQFSYSQEDFMNRSRLICFLGLIVMMTQVSFAQTTGTVTVTGSNPAAVSITNTSDSSISTTVALGTLTPATGGALTQGTFQVRLRSNKAYVLSAQATALSFNGLGSTDGGDTIALGDIGFGITALANTGTNVANTGSRTDSVVSLFDRTSGFPSVTNGLTPFVSGTHGTLNNITSNTQLLSGPRISSKGNISTSNNFILATLALATLPQYFTPNTDFSTTVTLTITAP